MASVNKAYNVGNFEQIAAELAIEKQYDYVICGHIHQPPEKGFLKTKKEKLPISIPGIG